MSGDLVPLLVPAETVGPHQLPATLADLAEKARDYALPLGPCHIEGDEAWRPIIQSLWLPSIVTQPVTVRNAFACRREGC